MRFLLGTHIPSWLTRVDVELFVSHRRLLGMTPPRRSLPKARGPWSLDSGGFTELSQFHEWRTTLPEYVDATRRYASEMGNLSWAAPMDWMCEPWITAKTGLTVADHQHRTVDNLLLLREAAPELPFVPVLQGWSIDDYVRCAGMYEQAGVDLAAEPLVGVGSVCRRQHTAEIEDIFRHLHGHGLKMHGFGVKSGGLTRYARFLTSADSMAWSSRARKAARAGEPNRFGCTHRCKSCSNCMTFALDWRARAIASIEAVDTEQLSFISDRRWIA